METNAAERLEWVCRASSTAGRTRCRRHRIIRGPSLSETNSLLYSGAVALDPVLRGVAQGLSALFPPVILPDRALPDEGAPTEDDAADGAP